VLRLQADFVLEACARYWNATKGHHECQGLAIAGGVGLAHAGLEKEYGQGAGLMGALDGVELDVASGETLAVMSPSGCGSRRCCICLEAWNAPRWGEVWLAGHRIDQLSEKALARLRRRAIGFVFQAFHLMDELTALENVELPRCSPAARPGRHDAGPRSCWNRSGSATGPSTSPRHSRAANGRCFGRRGR
jgi:putative ABC transport system ATP-binding protein